MTGDWLDRDAVRVAVGVIVAQVTKQYRVDAATATAWVRDVLGRDPDFRSVAEVAESGEKLLRTRAFKTAATAAKKHVYYSLRRYRPAGSDADALTALRELPPGADPAALGAIARTIAESHRST